MAYRPEDREDRSPNNRRPARKPPQLGAARHRPGEEDEDAPVRPYPSTPERRPAERPVNAGRAPANSPRPGDRRPKKRVEPRFFVILAVVLVVLIVAVVAVVKLKGGSTPSAQPAVTAQPASDAGDVQATEAPEDSASTSLSNDELAALLGSDDEVAALDDSQRVSVTDLEVNPDLPSEWMNVLLLGTDERALAEKGRTDSMIICSVNTVTGEVKLSSIMRDLAIDYKEMGYDTLGTYRINAANFFGGPEMAMQTVNHNFGLNIQNYVLVNFYGFQDAVEALGGITMDITEAEMNKINDGQKQVAGIAYREGVEGVEDWPNELLTEYGEGVHLNGQQALAYARIRKLDSDYARTERQRKVLMAILDVVKQKSALELAQLGATLMPYISTNMELNDILTVAVTVLSSNMEVSSMRLPVNGSYVEERRNNDAMLWDCDFPTNQQQLYNFIYN